MISLSTTITGTPIWWDRSNISFRDTASCATSCSSKAMLFFAKKIFRHFAINAGRRGINGDFCHNFYFFIFLFLSERAHTFIATRTRPQRTLLHFIRTSSENPSTHGATISQHPTTISIHRSAINGGAYLPFTAAVIAWITAVGSAPALVPSGSVTIFPLTIVVGRTDARCRRRRFFSSNVARMLVAVKNKR